jgi:hypothetical protein
MAAVSVPMVGPLRAPTASGSANGTEQSPLRAVGRQMDAGDVIDHARADLDQARADGGELGACERARWDRGAHAANTGTGATISVNDVTTGGTAPSGALGWEGAMLFARGIDAVNRVVTISDGTTTATTTLTSVNASTAALARTEIQAAINLTLLNGTITVGGSANRIDLAGKADGSNSITVGGANVDGCGVMMTREAISQDDDLLRELGTFELGTSRFSRRKISPLNAFLGLPFPVRGKSLLGTVFIAGSKDADPGS